MKELWTYDKEKRFSSNCERWHFVHMDCFDDNVPYEETPTAWYFRNDKNTIYGILKYDKRKENPHRDYMTMINRIMNKSEFRETLLDESTKDIWNKNWK
jgi:hypothetical protein